jgi:hypothetical protein
LKGITYVILGIKVYREGNVYSDFGGGCKTSKRELSYDCANREFIEESLGILQKNNNITHIFSTETIGSKKQLKTTIKFTVHQMLYFIDYTDILISETTDEYLLIDIRKKYHELSKKYQHPELEDIFIISYQTFKELPNSLLGENLYNLRDYLPLDLSSVNSL